MAAATQNSYTRPEGNASIFNNSVLHVWNLTAGNADTHDTGFGTDVAVKKMAAQYVSGGAVAPITAINGVITFAASASGTFNLLVWTDQ